MVQSKQENNMIMLPNYKLIGVLFKNQYKPFHKGLFKLETLFENYDVSRIELEMNNLYTLMIEI